MKLSILVVNWNTRDLVLKCVDSVLRNSPDFPFEVIVVDNDSRDGSAEALRDKFGSDARVKVISAAANLGFAKANNLAFQESQGQFVLLLNSDTDVRPGALRNLVAYLEAHPRVGVVGPKLLNPDRTTQPSVRRFPGPWSSLLVFSGLHRIIRPKSYLMDGFDYLSEAAVDQVMGACLLTRRSIIDKLGLLDERFYLWYEEVDFCRRVKTAGFDIKYYPGAEVMHHGAQSFSQLGVGERKSVAARSLKHYFRKNGSLVSRAMLGIMLPPILLLSRFVGWLKAILGLDATLGGWFRAPGTENKNDSWVFAFAVVAMTSIELLSFLSFVYPVISLPALVLGWFGVFIASLYRPKWGIYILFAELFMGSRGHLLEWNFLSLRLVVFTAVFAAWVIDRVRNREWRSPKLPRTYWILLIIIVFAAARGYFVGNGLSNIFFDANAYLYLLIFPAVLLIARSENFLESTLQILAGAVVVIAAKTLLLFVWFGYNLPGAAPLYHWIISFDLGEITGISGGAPRIFMQSQFYALVGLLVFLFRRKVRWGIVAAALAAVLLSLSRSLWLGAAAGLFFAGLILLFRFRERFLKVVRLGVIILLILCLEAGGLLLVTRMSPQGGLTESVRSRVGNPAQDAAGGARLLLLPELLSSIRPSVVFGARFGKTVTYKSYLPDRVTADNPDGSITSYAFEWGYLDTWLKIGLLGLVVYLLFIAHIFRLGWDAMQVQSSKFPPAERAGKVQNLGILGAFVGLVVLNVTTPYLNHPLGIGFLILSYASFKIVDFEM